MKRGMWGTREVAGGGAGAHDSGRMAWHGMAKAFCFAMSARALQIRLGLRRYDSSHGFLSISFYKFIF